LFVNYSKAKLLEPKYILPTYPQIINKDLCTKNGGADGQMGLKPLLA